MDYQWIQILPGADFLYSEFLLKVLMVEENLRLDFAKLLVCQYKLIFNGRYN